MARVTGAVKKLYENTTSNGKSQFKLVMDDGNGYTTFDNPRVSEGDTVAFDAEQTEFKGKVYWNIKSGVQKIAAGEPVAAKQSIGSTQPKFSVVAGSKDQGAIMRQSAFNYVAGLAAGLLPKVKNTSELRDVVAAVATISAPLAANYFANADLSALKQELVNLASPATE